MALIGHQTVAGGFHFLPWAFWRLWDLEGEVRGENPVQGPSPQPHPEQPWAVVGWAGWGAAWGWRGDDGKCSLVASRPSGKDRQVFVLWVLFSFLSFSCLASEYKQKLCPHQPQRPVLCLTPEGDTKRAGWGLSLLFATREMWNLAAAGSLPC